MTQEVLKLALKDLKWVDNWLGEKPMSECVTKLRKAITAIKEALAQPQQEPAYRAVKTFHEGKPVYVAESSAPPPECKTEAEKTAFAFGWFKALESVRLQPPHPPVAKPHEQEPVVFNTLTSLKHKKTVGPIESAMMKTPPPTATQHERKPLTEGELMKCITQAKCFDTVKMTYESGPYEIDRPTLKAFEFARAIEAARGIKGEKK